MPDQDSPKKPDPTSPDGPRKTPRFQEIVPSSPEEKFLRALSKFLWDRALYPENHPQILVDVSTLQTALSLLFSERPERVFVFIEDQIFVDDRLLPNAQRNTGDIAKFLRERQVDAFILRQGLTWNEFGPFLNSLLTSKQESSKQESSRKPAFHSPHIEIRELSSVEGTKPVVPSIIQDLGFSVSKTASKKTRFVDEAKLIRDIYTDWNTTQEALVNLVVKIMHVLEKGLFENHQSFIPLADLKSYDEYTYVHAINLAILTMAQAESMGFPKEAVHAFGVGALLHDVGKTQVPIDVLNKQGKLSPEEFEEMKKHPVHGAVVLLQYPEIPPIAAIVAYEHHLKYDGTGYPSMKQKRTPHVASRFTSISDQFDAMRSNRPYRDALPPEKIFELMQESRGTGLDPDLLDHFIAFMKSRKII
ncbi:MAG TPA: HD domain-containing phosphohydrolase [Nitrospiria bacterium]|nr:HD domain-containing phosphohydrolase [Nitrospiria bacterium]